MTITPLPLRQVELLRLRAAIDDYRCRYFPELPAVTVLAGESMAAHVLATSSPLGAWSQGIALTVRASLLAPVTPGIENRSLIWNLPLQPNAAGEQLRQLEANLVALHELVHVQHQWLYERGEASRYASEARSYEGHGALHLARCNAIWQIEADRLGLPFAPVRHSRVKREQEQQFVVEGNPALQPLTALRPSCAHWPHRAITAPWHGQPPAEPTEAEQQALALLPALIAAHHAQALAATNAAEALIELPPVPLLIAEPLAAPCPVVIEPEASSGFSCPFDPAGAIEAIRCHIGGRDLDAYRRFAELMAAVHREVITAEPPLTATTTEAAAGPAPTTAPPPPPHHPMASQDPPPTVEDLAHHAEDRIALAAAKDPLLGDVIALLRHRGELATTADWQQIADAHGRAIGTARSRTERARQLLTAAGVVIPRKAQVGDHVALHSSPGTTGVVAAVEGHTAHLQIHGSTNWLTAPLLDLDVIARRQRPVRSARVERIIASRRAARAQSTTAAISS